MMNVERARELNLEFITNKVDAAYNPGGIDKAIEDAARAGKLYARISLVKFEERISKRFFQKAKEEYEARGFAVKREKGYDDDPRGSSSWDYIQISW